MNHIVQHFHATGSLILNDQKAINSCTYPIDVIPQEFLNACSFCTQNSDKIAIVGMCFNISPYISKYFRSIDPSHFWTLLIHLSAYVDDFPAVFGYVEAVTEMAVKTKNVDQIFLNYLIDPTMENDFLKPIVLVAIFDFLPTLFLANNTDYFLPLILKSFHYANLQHRSTLLFILSRFKLSEELLNSNPDIEKIFWQFVFETSLAENEMSYIILPMERFQKAFPSFFDRPYEYINQIFDTIEEKKLFGLIKLMPFLNANYFQNTFQQLIKFVYSINSQINIELNSAVEESLLCKFIEPEIQYIMDTLLPKIKTHVVVDDAVIYLFTLYFQLLDEINEDSAAYLINAIEKSFTIVDSNKTILCFAISRIAEHYTVHSKRLKRSVLPSLINLFFSDDKYLLKYAAKALAKIHKVQAIRANEIIEQYLRIIPNVCGEGENCNSVSIKKIFKVITKIILRQLESLNLNPIFQILKKLFSTDPPNEVKCYMLSLCSVLFHCFYDESQQFFELCMNYVSYFLFSEYSYAYSCCANFLYYSDFFVNHPDKEGLFKRLIDITQGIVSAPIKHRRLTSNFTALISQKMRFAFPVETIREFINSDDIISQSRGIVNLQHSFTFVPDPALVELLAQIINLAKVKQCAILIDNIFLLCVDLIREKPEFVFQPVTDLLYSTVQGRIALLDHNFPFDYDYRKFKFYKMATVYIKYYRANSSVLISEFIDWIPQISDFMLGKLLKPINKALCTDSIISEQLPILWNALFTRLEEDWRNTDLANGVLGCMVNLLLDHPNICDPEKLDEHLIYMWNNDEETEEMKVVVPPIYFDIWANTNIPINFDIFKKSVDFLTEDIMTLWSPPLMISFLNKIVRKEEQNVDLLVIAAKAFAHFLMKKREELEELEFDEETLDKAKESLMQCVQTCEFVRDMLMHEYREYPAKTDKLVRMLDA